MKVRSGYTLLVLLLLAAIFVGCGDSEKSSVEEPRQHVRKIISTHAVGLCNMPMFITAEMQTAREFGVEVDLETIALAAHARTVELNVDLARLILGHGR